jgi:histidyl-tRNA synthetase
MKPQLAKGTRDIPPEDCIILQEVVDTLKRNFEAYGFNPLQTPIIERFDVLSSKYTGGAEILKEMYQLTDQGKRELALRYDLTVPFSRFVALNPQLKLPFKRYQIGRVFRDGPLKANRYREFTQCDCDVVGGKSITQDAECVELFLAVFRDLKLPVEIRVNNIKILNEIMTLAEIAPGARERVILAIDKLAKKSKKEVEKEIMGLGVTKKSVNKLFKTLDVKGSNKEKLKEIQKVLGKDSEGVKEMSELLFLLKDKQVKFIPTLARGLAYYTGTIYEVYTPSIKSSIGSGGRYDKMIGDLMGSKIEFPAVGCSFGLDAFASAIKANRKSQKKSVVQLYVIPIGLDYKEIWPMVKELRARGIKTDVGSSKKGVTKNLNYANSYKIPFVALVGENELKAKKLTLKNMERGKESKVTVEQIVKKLMLK